MPSHTKPRAGSLQFSPRKRARKLSARVRSWPKYDKVKLLGFPGYKVGMFHSVVLDSTVDSMTKGKEISVPITVLECPAIKILSLRCYKKTPYGAFVSKEVINTNVSKELARKISIPKKSELKLDDIKPDEYSELRVKVYTQPRKTSIGKKKPEIFEIALGGQNKDKFEFVKNNWDKEINLSDVFGSNCVVDIHGVTKGKGFQGVVKRFGVSLKSHKSEKGQRHAVHGGEGFSKTPFSAPQGGKMGYHLRTEYNKKIILSDSNTEKINRSGGIKHYGVVKNNYAVVLGSVQGPKKRVVLMTETIRLNKKIQKINYSIQNIIR